MELNLKTKFDNGTLADFLASIVQAGKDGKHRIAVTGAASGDRLKQFLTSMPGSSSSYLGGHSNYAFGWSALVMEHRDLGSATGSVNGAGLANAAYLQGQHSCLLDKAHTPHVASVAGLGTTAAFASGGRKGGDRIRLALRTATSFREALVHFPKGETDEERAVQHFYADLLLLNALLANAGLEQIQFDDSELKAEIGTLKRGQLTMVDLTRPEVSGSAPVLIGIDGSVNDLTSIDPASHVIYPGSYRRFHVGHDHAAKAATEQTDKQVVMEIVGNNADPNRPPVTMDDLVQRSLQFRGRWPVVLRMDCGLFSDKARAYGDGTEFVVGFDTAIRLVDKSFYGDDWKRTTKALDELKRRGARFHVLGRKTAEGFETADDIACARKHHGLFSRLAGRVDVSSTHLMG